MQYLRNAFHALVIIAIVAVMLAFKFVERFPDHAGPLPQIAAARTLVGPVSLVRDGDTIVVAGQPIRFGSLDCDERGSINGDRATNRMRSLISGQTLTCHLTGRNSYDRAIGSCVLSDGRDLAGVMIAENVCTRYW